MKDYIKNLRLKIGQDKFIHPAARIIIENEAGEILSIRRKDNGGYGIPAGAFEEGETIEACIRREVREETGLEVGAIELIGLSTNPETEYVKYPNGDEVQYFTAEFYSNDWTGNLDLENDEASGIRFRPPQIIEQLPTNERSTFQSLDYFRSTGKVYLH